MKALEKKCKFYHESILNYEWIDLEERKKLEEHLKTCPKCRKQHESIQRMETELTDLVGIEHDSPIDFSGDIIAALKSENKSMANMGLSGKFLLTAIIIEILFLAGIQTMSISSLPYVEIYNIFTTTFGSLFSDALWVSNWFSDALDLLATGWQSTVLFSHYCSLSLDWILIFADIFCILLLIFHLLIKHKNMHIYENHSI